MVDLGRSAVEVTRALGALVWLLLSAGCPHTAPDRSAPLPRPTAVASAEPEVARELTVLPSSAAPSQNSSSPAESARHPGLEPLTGERSLSLDVPGFLPAVVSVPVGASAPRPVALALHGNFDRPEWQCSVWAPIVGSRGFVVCPRGAARRDVPKDWDRWEYASGKAVTAEIEAALTALRARFGEYVDLGPILYIGFSLGAIYGVSLVQKEPARFPRVVLIEGGLGAWTSGTAKKFVQGGGARLILACGQTECLSRVKRLGPLLERAGLPTRVGGSPRAGHTYDGPVAQVVAENFEWLIDGDPRWLR